MKLRFRLLALLGCVFSAGETARAEDTSALQSLLDESVITTASATAELASAAPATSSTITAEDLRTFGIRSLAEAINYLSLGVVTSDPLRTPDIGSRGVLLTNDGGKHFLLLVNGHAINDPLYGAARFDQGAGIPIELIDHIEVTIGPGSVVYGSNAMMGVVNVITKNASGHRGGHAMAEYEFGRSYRAGASGGVTFSLFGTPSELTAGVEYYERIGPDLSFTREQYPFADIRFRRGGPADGVWGGTVRDAYFVRAPSGLLRLHVGDFEVNLMASSYRRGIPYSTETIEVNFDDKESYERDHSVRLDIRHDASLNSVVHLTSRAYGDAFAYQRVVTGIGGLGCARYDIVNCTYHDVGRAQWIGLEERLAFNWMRDGTFVTTLGTDLRGQWVQTKEDAFNFEEGVPIGPTLGRLKTSGSIVSPYVQQTWTPVTWLDLNGGARVDKDNRYSPRVSPRAAIALRPRKSTTLRAIYSEAFRAPTWSETELANYRLAPGYLRAETVRSAEASLEQRFLTHRILFGVFRTWWDNLVALGPIPPEEQNRLQREGVLPLYVPPGIAQHRNVASLENYGLNGTWDGTLNNGRFHYGVNLTEAFTQRRSGGVSGPLAVAPQFFGNLHLAYAFGGYAPTVALAVSYLGKRPADRALTAGAPVPYAEALAEFRLTLTGKVPAVTGLSYRVSATYATAAEGAYTAGPNLAYATGGGGIGGLNPPPLSFAPIDQFSAFAGLKYDFATGETP